MGNMLPITSKLWPRAGNLMYLAEVAVLTRLATGVARVMENRPSQQKDPNMSESQKKQAMSERFFVEIFGTMGYMFCLHLGQDVVDKISNRLNNNERFGSQTLLNKATGHDFKKDESFQAVVNKWKNKLGLEVTELDTKLKAAIGETYSLGQSSSKPSASNLIARSLYGETNAKGEVVKTNMATVKNKLAETLKIEPDSAKREALDKAFKEIVNEVKPLKALAQRSNNLAILGIMTGVATSAVVGGTVTQWLNDRMVAPTAKKFFARNNKGAEPLMGQAPAASSPVMGQPVQPQLSLLSAAPSMPVSLNPTAPVYLPNPKMQPSTAHFASQALRPTVGISPYSRLGGPF